MNMVQLFTFEDAFLTHKDLTVSHAGSPYFLPYVPKHTVQLHQKHQQKFSDL